jgi:hypothetical protein
VAHMGERRGAYRVLVGKPEGSTPRAPPIRSWEENKKLPLQDVGWGGGVGMVWINLAQDRDRWLALVNAVMNLWIP